MLWRGTKQGSYHGQADLQNKCLRHVSPAFAEDPVRILRLGRFLARYASLGFTVAQETILLMQQMVKAGEVNALVAERVWKELVRALGENHPEKFFAILHETGAFPILFPGLTVNGPGQKALLAAVGLTPDPMVRLAAFLYAENNATLQMLINRYRLPNAYRELVLLTANHHEAALQATAASAEQLLRLFSALDIYRRKQRFHEFLLACAAIALAKNIPFDATWLLDIAEQVSSIDINPLLREGLAGNKLAARIKELRFERLTAWLQK
jgi:tRNA nucleotidyltransferase (CCA-adding enzyme)